MSLPCGKCRHLYLRIVKARHNEDVPVLDNPMPKMCIRFLLFFEGLVDLGYKFECVGICIELFCVGVF